MGKLLPSIRDNLHLTNSLYSSTAWEPITFRFTDRNVKRQTMPSFYSANRFLDHEAHVPTWCCGAAENKTGYFSLPLRLWDWRCVGKISMFPFFPTCLWKYYRKQVRYAKCNWHDRLHILESSMCFVSKTNNIRRELFSSICAFQITSYQRLLYLGEESLHLTSSHAGQVFPFTQICRFDFRTQVNSHNHLPYRLQVKREISDCLLFLKFTLANQRTPPSQITLVASKLVQQQCTHLVI